MTAQEIISKYLTFDQMHIKPISSSEPIKSKDELFSLFKWWLKLSSSKSIGDLSIMNKNRALIYVVIGSSTFYVNADTKRKGVEEFFKNRENNWSVIMNEDGKKNKITNRQDKNKIENFFMYKNI